jgi:fructokinase
MALTCIYKNDEAPLTLPEDTPVQVLSIGEILWDVFADKETLGGAPLNFTANVVRLGDRASLITGIGEDERGDLALDAMTRMHLDTDFVQRISDRPTGIARVITSAEGEPRFEIPRPAAFDSVQLSATAIDKIRSLRPNWFYFGTLFNMEPDLEQTTLSLAHLLPDTRCFYDMNLRLGGWSLALVQRLCGIASILKLNEFEAHTLGASIGMGPHDFSLKHFCHIWSDTYQLECICVTLGAAGCMVYANGEVNTIPGIPTIVQDTVGAGDAFAAGFLFGHHRGWSMFKTARFANVLGSIVAGQKGATPVWSLEQAFELI